MSSKHDTTKVRIHSSTKRGSGGREFKQHCVRWYHLGKRKQRCFTTLAEAKAFKLDVERTPGGEWLRVELDQSVAAKLEELAKCDGISPSELLGRFIMRGAIREGLIASPAAPEKHQPVPRGMKLIVRSLGTGQRMLFGKAETAFLQSVGEEPKEMDLATSVALFNDLLHSHDGHELGDGAKPYLCIVALGLMNKGAK